MKHDGTMDAHLYAMSYLAQLIQDASIHFPTTDSTFYEELGTSPNVIDSTATVIDENVKALPAPEVQP